MQIDQKHITVDQAKAIIAAFGPCTALYECCSPEELVERFEDDKSREPEKTVGEYLGTLLAVEGINAERMDESGECYREWKVAKPAVIVGLTALGYSVS